MQASGYNEYTRNRENMLTEEQIKEYEEDIEAGKDVTIKDYLNKDKVNYDNKVSGPRIRLIRINRRCF